MNLVICELPLNLNLYLNLGPNLRGCAGAGWQQMLLFMRLKKFLIDLISNAINSHNMQQRQPATTAICHSAEIDTFTCRYIYICCQLAHFCCSCCWCCYFCCCWRCFDVAFEVLLIMCLTFEFMMWCVLRIYLCMRAIDIMKCLNDCRLILMKLKPCCHRDLPLCFRMPLKSCTIQVWVQLKTGRD